MAFSNINYNIKVGVVIYFDNKKIYTYKNEYRECNNLKGAFEIVYIKHLDADVIFFIEIEYNNKRLRIHTKYMFKTEKEMRIDKIQKIKLKIKNKLNIWNF